MRNKNLMVVIYILAVMLMISLGNTNTAPNIDDINTENTEEPPKSSYGDIIFQDDFESGLSQWEMGFAELWHLTETSSHSATHTMWFGQEATGDYDTGFTEFGLFYSIPFDLSDQDEAYLVFYHWRERKKIQI